MLKGFKLQNTRHRRPTKLRKKKEILIEIQKSVKSPEKTIKKYKYISNKKYFMPTKITKQMLMTIDDFSGEDSVLLKMD